MAGRTGMGSFAKSKIGVGLVAALLLLRVATHFGPNGGFVVIAAAVIALFAGVVFQTLTK